MHATLNTRKKQRVPIDPHSFSPPPRTHKYAVTPPSVHCEAHSAERTDFTLSWSAVMLAQLKQRVLQERLTVFRDGVLLDCHHGGNKKHLAPGAQNSFIYACSLRETRSLMQESWFCSSYDLVSFGNGPKRLQSICTATALLQFHLIFIGCSNPLRHLANDDPWNLHAIFFLLVEQTPLFAESRTKSRAPQPET
jgi:hypothetical protein